MMDCCIGEQQWSTLDMADLLVETRKSSFARQKSRGRRSHRSGSRCIRASSEVDFDTGFGLPVRKYPLWLEICSAGPPLQRITRSSRSRPSLHGMASKCVLAHCTRTRMEDWTGRMGCGTGSAHLGGSNQAAARQPHSCCASISDSKSTTSRCCGGALEAHRRPLLMSARGRCTANVMCSDHRSWCAHRAPAVSTRGASDPVAKTGF